MQKIFYDIKASLKDLAFFCVLGFGVALALGGCKKNPAQGEEAELGLVEKKDGSAKIDAEKPSPSDDKGDSPSDDKGDSPSDDRTTLSEAQALDILKEKLNVDAEAKFSILPEGEEEVDGLRCYHFRTGENQTEHFVTQDHFVVCEDLELRILDLIENSYRIYP